jgi:hypothetical protein
MNTPYASQFFHGQANLFIGTYYEIAGNMLQFMNERRATLHRVALAYHDALKQAKVLHPENDFYRLRVPAMELISTRINGGRYVKYRGYEMNQGVAFLVDGKKVRVDIHDIHFMLSIIVADEDTLNTKASLKKHFTKLDSINYQEIHTGGNIAMFSPYDLTITLKPIEGIKPAKSRTEHSAVGRFLLKQLKNVECFGSQSLYRKVTTIDKKGNLTSHSEFYGERQSSLKAA